MDQKTAKQFADAKTEEEKAILFAYHCKKSAAFFAEHVMRFIPTPQQRAILDAYSATGGCKIAVKSGHGTGKTAVASCIVLHHLAFNALVEENGIFREDCRALCTAPSSAQLFDGLWAECSKWVMNMEPQWRSKYRCTADRICIIGSESSRFATARTAKRETPEALQGQHSHNMLVVVDEASGVPDIIFEVGAGAMSTPSSKVILLSNPTRTEGYLYDVFTEPTMSKNWKQFTLSCVDSPLVDKKWIEDNKRIYGEDSDFYRVRVLGQFPKGSPDALIPIHCIESSIGRDIKSVGARVYMGVDVARFGSDFSAIVVRRGGEILHVDRFNNMDTTFVAGKVIEYCRANTVDRIFVDTIGVGGGVADQLRGLNFPVSDVNVHENASLKAKYARLRDELWYTLREQFIESKIAIPKANSDDPSWKVLMAQLGRIKYGFVNGKVKIASKEEMKKDSRGESPDVADAMMMSYYAEVMGDYARTHGSGSWAGTKQVTIVRSPFFA